MVPTMGERVQNPRHTHPFISRVDLSTPLRLRGALLGCVLFPLRMALCLLFMLAMWPVARLRLAGLPAGGRGSPVRGWRRWLLHLLMVLLSRAVFFCMGFTWIRVKGRRAPQVEAPVLAVAPHSSFLDMLVLPVSGLPVVVSRVENAKLPIIGALLEFNQAVLVSRKDPESRRKCVSQIKERLTSTASWPQMLMFPEGTTTNGHALIKFKPGAFLAGVPVQPVLLHYPNRTDTVRWTWKGTSWLDCLWYTSTQLYTNVTVEFLPVYTPCEEEKQNPELYADNVQKLMAKSLGIPATHYVMEGLVPVTKLGGLSVPLESPAKETLALLKHNGVSRTELEEMMNRLMVRCSSGLSSSITTEELRSLLNLSHPTALKICSLYSKNDSVDARQLCVSVCTAAGLRPLQTVLHSVFSLYDSDGDGLLSADELSGLMGALVGIPQLHVIEMYSQLIERGEPTEGALYDLLTAHPTYRRLLPLLHAHPTDPNHNGIPNGKTVRNE